MPNEREGPWLSISALMRRWQCTRETALRTCNWAAIELVPFGARWRVRRIDVERFEQGAAGDDVVERLARAVRGRP